MAFATTTELANRLGQTFTTAQTTQAEAALDAASAVIAAEIDKDEADITAVPDLLKHVTITVAARILANPSGVMNESERLGAHQHSKGYRPDGGVELTQVERLLCRRAVYGVNSDSTRPESTADEVYDALYS